MPLPERELLVEALSLVKKWRLATHGRVSSINLVSLVESVQGSLEAVLSEPF